MLCAMSNFFKRTVGILKRFGYSKREQLMYDISEASRITGIRRRKIYELIKQGKIKSLQLQKGGSFHIHHDEIERIKHLN